MLTSWCIWNLQRLYPSLIPDVKIKVVELMDYVLSTYDRKIGEYTAKVFKRNGEGNRGFVGRTHTCSMFGTAQGSARVGHIPLMPLMDASACGLLHPASAVLAGVAGPDA